MEKDARKEAVITRISRTGQQDDLVFDGSLEAFVKHFGVVKRIEHGGLGGVPFMEMQMAKLLQMHLRFRLIQPEIVDALS